MAGKNNNVELSKGKSPFYPGQPVPLEFFVGRQTQINRIIERGAAQVQEGKPIAIFTQGEYGIGKSSFASYVQALAEKEHGLYGIYASLGGCKSINDMAVAIMEATLRSGALNPSMSEKIRNWLAQYVGSQGLFGLTVDLTALKKDAPKISSAHSMLSFLSEVYKRLRDGGINGIFLTLDEINGIVYDSDFSQFIKNLVDTNALSGNPLPLLLLLCGVEEKRKEMINRHQPVERIFDIVEIDAMNESEMREFFTRTFNSVQIEVDEEAMGILTYYSAGFPKIMHHIGDAAYWLDKDGLVDKSDATRAILLAADEVGKKYVDQQVYKALQSDDYKSTLDKIVSIEPSSMIFTKASVDSRLTSSERRKFANFIKRMKDLNVIKSGSARGEYVFNMRMVHFYLWMRGTLKKKNS